LHVSKKERVPNSKKRYRFATAFSDRPDKKKGRSNSVRPQKKTARKRGRYYGDGPGNGAPGRKKTSPEGALEKMPPKQVRVSQVWKGERSWRTLIEEKSGNEEKNK